MLSRSSGTSFLGDLVNYIPSKVIPAALGFLLVILLTHGLVPQDYGTYAIILAYARIADTLASAWLRQSTLRYYPEFLGRDQAGYFQRNALSILVLAMIFAGLAASIIMWGSGYGLVSIALMLCVLFTLAPFNHLTTLYQSSRSSGQYAFISLIQSAVQILWVFLFVYVNKFGYQHAVLAVSGGYAVGIGYMFVRRRKTKVNFRPSMPLLDRALARKLLLYGAPMALWVLCFQLLFQANRVIIGILRSQEEVGVYASTFDLINGSISLIITPFLLSAHPIIMQYWAESKNGAAIERLLEKVVRYLLLIGIPITSLSIAINNRLFETIFGNGYGVEAWVVPVLVATSFVAGMSMYVHKGLEVTERTPLMLAIAVITVLINIGLNFALVRRFGYPASALVALFSYVFYMFAAYYFSKQHVRLRVSPTSVVRALLASSVALLISWFGQRLYISAIGNLGGMIVIVLGFLFVYLGVLLIIGELNDERRQLVIMMRALRTQHQSVK